MFAVLYRFQIKEGQEALFLEAWEALTFLYREEAGGLGSRLHKAEDHYWAYAQWPNVEIWQNAELSEKAQKWRQQMKEALQKSEVLFKGEVEKDLLL